MFAGEVKFAAWSVTESPITIEYSLIVIEEIRHAVAEGFQRLSRGGIEVGGILYGAREGRTVKVLAMRSIACEHARGPAFLLSDKDRVVLNEQLASDAQDAHLEGLISVGVACPLSKEPMVDRLHSSYRQNFVSSRRYTKARSKTVFQHSLFE